MNVRVDLSSPIYDGMEVVFKAPCDAAQVTGLNLYYPKDGVQESQQFAFADANANDVGDIDALFATGAVVKVILDLETHMAFIQNADTNSYLENRFKGQVGLDTTLSVEGKAADAKAVGDAIAELSSASGGVAEVYAVEYDMLGDRFYGNFDELVAAFQAGKIVMLWSNDPVGGRESYICYNYSVQGFNDYNNDCLMFGRICDGFVAEIVILSDGTIIRGGFNGTQMQTDIDTMKKDMGDIDAALDAIIAIQNSLIGGEGA